MKTAAALIAQSWNGKLNTTWRASLRWMRSKNITDHISRSPIRIAKYLPSNTQNWSNPVLNASCPADQLVGTVRAIALLKISMAAMDPGIRYTRALSDSRLSTNAYATSPATQTTGRA